MSNAPASSNGTRTIPVEFEVSPMRADAFACLDVADLIPNPHQVVDNVYTRCTETEGHKSQRPVEHQRHISRSMRHDQRPK